MKKYLIVDPINASEVKIVFMSGQVPSSYIQLLDDRVECMDDLVKSGNVYNYDASRKVARLAVEEVVKIKAKRDILLKECDFTQLGDAPLSSLEKQAWRDYRQELRDLPSTITDPYAVVWPTKPE